MKWEIDPNTSSRAAAFALWMGAPNPMVTLVKPLDVTRAVRVSRKRQLKFNMLMLWCVGKAASGIAEFRTLPVDGKLMRYDALAVSTIVKTLDGGICSCDLKYFDDLTAFSREYLTFTSRAAQTGTDRDLSGEAMVIGTSALTETELDAAVGIYSGIFNNPFLIWGRYRKKLFRYTLPISFQFHHTQMDGAQAARFLNALQRAVDAL